jgi:hypothetical protein
MGEFKAENGSEVIALRFPENQIDGPATANVRAGGVAAMVQNHVVVAAGVLKGIRENRHRAEVTGLVDVLSQ